MHSTLPTFARLPGLGVLDYRLRQDGPYRDSPPPIVQGWRCRCRDQSIARREFFPPPLPARLNSRRPVQQHGGVGHPDCVTCTASHACRGQHVADVRDRSGAADAPVEPGELKATGPSVPVRRGARGKPLWPILRARRVIRPAIVLEVRLAHIASLARRLLMLSDTHWDDSTAGSISATC